MVGNSTEQHPSQLRAYVDSESAEIMGNPAGLATLVDAARRGTGELHLDEPTFFGRGVSAMATIEINACEGLIVVSSVGDVLRIEGSLDRLQTVIAGGVANMLRAPTGTFKTIHLDARLWQGFATSSLNLVIFKE